MKHQRTWQVFGVLLAVVCMVMVQLSFAQDSTPEPTPQGTPANVPSQIGAALSALGTEVGTAIELSSLERYVYEEQVFNDSSLGCPQEGQSYAQATTRGYRFELVYQGQQYEYRISEDGTNVVYCGVNEAVQATAEAGITVGERLTCDSTLALLVSLAVRDYGYETDLLDLNTFDFGQYSTIYSEAHSDMDDMGQGDQGQATEEPGMDMDQATEEPGTSADQATEEAGMGQATLEATPSADAGQSGTGMSMTQLTAPQIANEDPVCTQLRADVEAFFMDALMQSTMDGM
ncbi:MAG: hypothetical protein MUF87_11125 [Anaerolineae bacterium]|nr:hypothetical protein [Anaerolineae bacterium]